MTETPDQVDAILANLDLKDTAKAVRAVEKLSELKGKNASLALAELLRTAPPGPITARICDALERRRHKTALDTLHEVYDQRPELWEDVIPALAPIADERTIARFHKDARRLMRSPARLVALESFIAAMDKRSLGLLLLDLRYDDNLPAAHDDLEIVLESALAAADEASIQAINAQAERLGPEAKAFVAPYLPPESELEREAPRIARELLRELARQELIEIMPDSEDALVIQLSRTMVEAHTPKALLRDVERILEASPATEELYASKDDIKRILENLARRK